MHVDMFVYAIFVFIIIKVPRAQHTRAYALCSTENINS